MAEEKFDFNETLDSLKQYFEELEIEGIIGWICLVLGIILLAVGVIL